MKAIRGWLLAVGVMAALSGATRGDVAATEELYSDPDAQSSVTITQVLPNSSTSQLVLTNVRSIKVRQDILVIEWGGTATTLLPRQYVLVVTANKRAAATRPGGDGVRG